MLRRIPSGKVVVDAEEREFYEEQEQGYKVEVISVEGEERGEEGRVQIWSW